MVSRPQYDIDVEQMDDKTSKIMHVNTFNKDLDQNLQKLMQLIAVDRKTL